METILHEYTLPPPLHPGADLVPVLEALMRLLLSPGARQALAVIQAQSVGALRIDLDELPPVDLDALRGALLPLWKLWVVRAYAGQWALELVPVGCARPDGDLWEDLCLVQGHTLELWHHL